MKPGPAVKGHASDEVVSGRIAKVSVEIESASGESKELKLEPETLIDGKSGNHRALKEGQQVRASFNEVEGKPVAVEIHSRQGGAAGSRQGGSSGQGGSTERGSTGSSQGGSQQQGSSGDTGGSQQQR